MNVNRYAGKPMAKLMGWSWQWTSLPSTTKQRFVASRCRLVPWAVGLLLVGTSLLATAATPLTTLRRETRTLLREEATAPEGDSKDATIAALCDIYVILRKDDRYEKSEMLKADATKVRRRLLTACRRRKASLKRQGIERPATISAEVDSAIEVALQDASKRAEAKKANSRPINTKGAQSRQDESRGRDSDGDDSRKTGKLSRLGGFGGGLVPDQGWQLVELIERVISPDFWAGRGGPGTIRYFAMRRVLVVRATTDVHEQIRDLLMALR